MNRSLSGIGRWLAAGCLALLASAALADEQLYFPPVTDPPTGTYTPGRWVWAELLTRDVGRAAEFYGKVFGWTFETFGPKDDAKTYTLVESAGTPIGGMVFVQPRDRSMKADARWVGLMSVPDVDAAAAKATQAGGKVVMPPRELGQRGRGALLADREGAIFGVLHSATGDPEDYLAGTNQWFWIELWADDETASAEFYRQVGGYEVVPGGTKENPRGLRLVSGGYARGGVLHKPLADAHSAWVPYVRVTSVTATVAAARAAGGRIAIEPTEVAGTHAALIVDPTGAPFAVAEWPAAGAQP